jgi:hypothetical protein
MKTSTRWVLFLVGAAVLIASLYYFALASWPVYSTIPWKSHHFGPRIFPWGSFLGLLIVFTIGFALYKLLFQPSGSQLRREEDDFCPYCGRKFRQGESIPGVCSRSVEKEKA